MLDKVHLLRSRYLDSFAKLESEVAALATLFGAKQETSTPFGQRINAFRVATIADKKRKARLDDLVDELALNATSRAYIVHAVIRLVIDAEDKTALIQFQSVPVQNGLCYSIAFDEMAALPTKIAQLSNRIKQFRITPAPTAPAASSAKALAH